MPPLRQAHLQRIYRPIITLFLLIAIAVLGGVVYVGGADTVITLTPARQEVSASFPVTFGDTTDLTRGQIKAVITTEELSETVIATSASSGALVPGRARGRVTLYNETNRTQPLAATTRLRSENGQIVRTVARTDVPAQGQITVEAVADATGADGNIPPGKFTIVALATSLQAQIYGESTEAFSGGLVPKDGSLGVAELAAASNQAEAAIRQRFGPNEPGLTRLLYPASVSSDPKPEVPSAEYNVTVGLQGFTVRYEAADLERLSSRHLADQTPSGLELRSLDLPTFALQGKPEVNTLNVMVKIKGQAVTDTANPGVQPDRFLNLDRAGVIQRAISSGLASQAQVNFSPWWRRTTPSRPENITVILAEPGP